tara:strand:- start:520 stop:786 length:267 start_codon:yes stop_codon:yes gene_type:complete
MVVLTSAEDRGVIRTSVLFSVEVKNLSTIGNVVMDLILHLNLKNGRKCGHLIVSARVPDSTLGETMLTRALREVIDLCGRGGESHVFP